jgi:hypothetical protein
MTDLYSTTLNLLRRVDDDVILSVATRALDMGIGDSCLCGWVVREGLARLGSLASPDDREAYNDWRFARERVPTAYDLCADLYGGDRDDWWKVYTGANEGSLFPHVEAAFVQRVDEAVQGVRP